MRRIGAIEQEVVLCDVGAVEGQRGDTAAADLGRRREQRQAGEIAAVHRKLEDAASLDGGGNLGRLSVDQRRGRGHGQRLRQGLHAELERQVDALADADRDLLAQDRAEASHVHANGVLRRVQVGHSVETLGVGHLGGHRPGLDAGHGDGGARKHASRVVGDTPFNRSHGRLCVGRLTRPQKEQESRG